VHTVTARDVAKDRDEAKERKDNDPREVAAGDEANICVRLFVLLSAARARARRERLMETPIARRRGVPIILARHRSLFIIAVGTRRARFSRLESRQCRVNQRRVFWSRNDH